jgi:DSBA-like thioredoxin domain-containing protein
MTDVEFFFDFVSPYTYLARTQLDAIAARTGARFRTRPMHLLNLMKLVGNTPNHGGVQQQAEVRRAGHREVVHALRSPVQDESSSSRRSQSDLVGCTGCAGNEPGRAIQPSDVFRVLD